MKKIIAILMLTSCTIQQKTTKDLKTLQTWIQQDYRAGEIPYANANNYYIILESIIYNIEKKEK
tara:strand:+ start:122 stop:313 length:192 start_codon:yes stop_codon:yes gene_type:complete